MRLTKDPFLALYFASASALALSASAFNFALNAGSCLSRSSKNSLTDPVLLIGVPSYCTSAYFTGFKPGSDFRTTLSMSVGLPVPAGALLPAAGPTVDPSVLGVVGLVAARILSRAD